MLVYKKTINNYIPLGITCWYKKNDNNKTIYIQRISRKYLCIV